MGGHFAPTRKHGRASIYKKPGGAWDLPPLNRMLAAAPKHDDLVSDDTTRLSTDALEDAVVRIAGGLRKAGARRRDVVAWQLPNRWEAVALYRACWRIGCVAAPIHHLAGAAEVEATLGSFETPPALVIDEDRLPSLLDAPRIKAAADVPPGWPAVVLFTSGSSGAPKGVVHSHRGLAYKARLMLGIHALDDTDSVLMPAPLAHISGLLNGVLLPGVGGLRAVLQAKWDPETALDVIERERVSFMVGPPTFFIGLRGAPSFSPTKVGSLRLLSCGGAGVTPDFVADTADAFDAVVKRTYGSTEAPTVTTAHHGDAPERARLTDGRPTGEVQLRIAGDGELLLRGPELFCGYVDKTQNDHAFMPRTDWFRTGDRGVIDDEGWLTITGRIKDVIIRGGENIDVAEIEATCEAHPAVRQAVAVAEADERLGERVAVFVVLAPGESFDVADAGRWFAERGLARFKTPERVIEVEQMPTLPAGKPDRAALRARL